MKALLYLSYRQLINSIINIASSPKRLVPAILIVVGVFMVIVMNLVASNPAYTAYRRTVMPLSPEVVWALVFALLSLVMARIVLSAFSEGRLVYTPSQIDFLFPSPISHRSVLAVKLLSDCTSYAIVAGFIFIFGAPSIYRSFGSPPYPSILVSWLAAMLLLIATMNMTHALNLVTSAGIRRLAIVRGIVKLALLLIVAGVAITAAIYFARTGDVLASLISALQSGFAKTVLVPITWCTNLIVGPIVQESYGSSGRQLLWLALLTAGSYVIVLARAESSYEPSLAISARMARVNAARRSGDWGAVILEIRRGKGKETGCVTPIPPFGIGAWALLWKMLVTQIRTRRWSLALIVLLPIIAAVVGNAFRHSEVLRFAPVVIPYATWYLALMLGMQGLRSELRHADIIKALPDTGFLIVAVPVFGQWLAIFGFIIIAGISIGAFIPMAEPHLLGLMMITSMTAAFSCLAACSIVVLLYPNPRDKLAMTIPGCISSFLIMAVIAPSAIIAGVSAAFRSSLVGTALFLVAANALIVWGALRVAGSIFKSADPNES